MISMSDCSGNADVLSHLLGPEELFPLMLEEPELRAQCDFLEYPLYHFDGIEQIRHLDRLLSIEKLHCIQWTLCPQKVYSYYCRLLILKQEKLW